MDSIAKVTNIDILIRGQESLNEKVAVPGESIQDKVFHIFLNNLIISNIEQKGKDLEEAIEEKFYPWVAQYLVIKIASREPSLHTMLAEVIHQSNTDLVESVTQETHRNIKVLSKSNLEATNFSDRTLLKNLGHWLGLITLAKNIPILYEDIDLKTLLYEANIKGSQYLQYVVPFVVKVLESCVQTSIFKPPNPWTMGLMNVLAELNQQPNLKVSLKFEIEVLCNKLAININYLRPGHYLMDERKLTKLENQLPTPSPVNTNTSAPSPRVTSPTSKQVLMEEQQVLTLAVGLAMEQVLQSMRETNIQRYIKMAEDACEQITEKSWVTLTVEKTGNFMTSGLSLKFCREQVLVSSLTTHLEIAFLNTIRHPSPPEKILIKSLAVAIAKAAMCLYKRLL